MNLTIKSKLIGGFAIILALLISMLFFMINKFSESNVRLTTIADVYSKKINLADELMIAVLNEASNEKNIIMEKDIIQMDYYKDNIYKALETIDNKTIELQELSDEKGILFLNEFKTTWAEYKPQLNKIISLTMNDKKDEASSISFEIGLKTRNIAIAQLQRIIDKNEKSMENAKIENNASYNAAVNLIIALIIASILIAIIISYWIIQSITKRISLIATEAEKIANREFSNEKLEDNTNDELKPIFNSLVSVNESFREIAENANNVADGNYTVNLIPRSDKDILANALIKMTRSLLETTEANKKHNWLAVGQIQLNEKLSGDQSIEELANKVISFLCTYLNANVGTVYRLNDKDKTLVLCGQYAFSSQESIIEKFALNEGLIGQAAWEQKQMLLTDITENQLRITSSVLNAKPKNLIITPFLLDGKTLGVIEIGKFTDFSETEKEFIDVSMNSISISVYAVHQAQEKENRAAELSIANKELAFQNEEKEKRAAELIIANYARSLIEASLDPLVTISAEGKILDVNEASVKVTGIPREKLIDTDFSNYFTEPKKAQEGYLQVFEKGFVSDYPLTIKHKNGNLTDVLYNASVYKDEKGNVLGVFAAARDITEQKQVSQYARSLIEASLDPLVTISAEGKILDVNEASVKVTGIPREKLIDTDFSNYFTEPKKAQEGYLQVFEKGFVSDYPLTIKHKNGNFTDVLYNASVYKDVKRNVLGVFAAARDVTEQKQASQYARSLIEASLDPLVTISAEGKILDVNEASVKVTGVPREKLIDTDFSNYFTEPKKAQEGYLQVFEKGFVSDYPLTVKHKNGNLTDVLYNASVYKDENGNVLGVFAAARDVTEQQWTIDLKIANKELAKQAEELQTQQEEMKHMNEELEEQAQNLKAQQEELQMSNEELEEQTQSLEEKNKEVEASKYDIEQKTIQLEISSKYKSEFLANMSHELRTPLNSLLILSKDLSENKKKNLDAIQVECSEIIYKSGHDLLVLINEVLDLSKIEAGMMTINIESVSLKNISDRLIQEFKHLAEQKKLKLTCTLDKELPEFIRTDSQRLNQILKNLLSNAIKFTEKGKVSINIKRNTDSTLIVSVTDTGIGIQENKQMAIFEAFQQADGGTSRKYGGTGLGLSISRELAKLLGAEIKLSSKLNVGSTFSLIIPIEINPEQEPITPNMVKDSILYKPRSEKGSKYLNYPTIEDDRETITKDDKVVLIIEDDLNFSTILLKQANTKGFKCLFAATGEDGLLLASKYKPQAIILDMELPGINGHTVLHELKANPSLRHIPVHIISANERSLLPIKEGAVEYLMKPVNKNDLEEAFNRIENFVNRKIKNLLIIEDNENSRKAMRILIGNGDVKCLEAGTGKEALTIYEQNNIDCIILDIGLPDISGFDLIHKIENIKSHQIPPIIIYTGKELTKEENNELQKYAETIIIKGIKSEERLLDETALFLHRTVSNLPKSKQDIIHNLYDKESVFHSKKILLVDDDMRNVFALSKVLQERGMEIIKAENGKIALEMMGKHPAIDMVLMDIMMPEMDGYEAMKQIRSQVKFKNIPVIALTAKAMKDDKQKCIDAGANDYIAKPIDVERLLSLMRVWLSK